MSAGYQPVPTSYPPESATGPPFPLRTKRASTWTIIKYGLGLVVTFAAAHYLLTLVFPNSSLLHPFRPKLHGSDFVDYAAAEAAALEVLNHIDPSSKTPGTFFRDSYPIRSALAFWDLAERQVDAKGLDTCDGQISRELVEAYHATRMTYCSPGNEFELAPINLTHTPLESPATYISCSAVHRNPFTKWWPYPAAPCISSNIRFVKGDQRAYLGVCDVTADGQSLRSEMVGENFVGSDLTTVDEAECMERIDHTVMIIKRQDQWNP